MSYLTIAEHREFNSVFINGILIPTDEIGRNLLRFSEPFVLHNPDCEDYPITIRGTAFRALYLGKQFLFASDHQSKDYEPQAACIINTPSDKIVTSNVCGFSNVSPEGGPEHDLRMYDFSEAVTAGALSANGWFDIQKSMLPGEHVAAAVCVGFPHAGTKLDYARPSIDFAPRAVFGTYKNPISSEYHQFFIKPNLDYEPDGFSGAPVYGVTLVGKDANLKFAGIVTNGNSGCFYFLDVGLLKMYFDSYFENNRV
ncbi:MAG: hypothetical protein AAF748_05260 [Pseudomonadota bacterium]